MRSSSGFLARQRANPAEARKRWLDVLAAAARVGDQVAGGDEPPRDEAPVFAGLVVRATQLPFPLPYASAGSAAQGFALIARGFVTAAQPEVRKALAGAMAQAARCCARLIELEDAQQLEAFQAQSQRRLGEKEE